MWFEAVLLSGLSAGSVLLYAGVWKFLSARAPRLVSSLLVGFGLVALGALALYLVITRLLGPP